MIFRILSIFIVGLTVVACSSSPQETKPIIANDKSAEELFKEANDAMDTKSYATAAKLFDEVERLHPYSDYANKAQLLAGEAFYQNQDYDDAVFALDRFLELHPGSSEIPYAYYLKALCYYEQISDVERDQETTILAKNALQQVYMRFPNTSYANDARLKYDLTLDHLAGKEMTIGRYYLNRNEYIGAMNRFSAVIDNFQTSSHTPEALYRLTEVYLVLDLKDDAKKTAAVLGHNFPDSQWYSMAYDLIKDEGL